MATSIVLTLCQAISSVLSICINSFNSTFRIYITTQSKHRCFPCLGKKDARGTSGLEIMILLCYLRRSLVGPGGVPEAGGLCSKSRGRRYSCQTGLEAAGITCRGTNKVAFHPHSLPLTPLGPKQSPSLLTHAKQAAYCQGTPYSF